MRSDDEEFCGEIGLSETSQALGGNFQSKPKKRQGAPSTNKYITCPLSLLQYIDYERRERDLFYASTARTVSIKGQAS